MERRGTKAQRGLKRGSDSRPRDRERIYTKKGNKGVEWREETVKIKRRFRKERQEEWGLIL